MDIDTMPAGREMNALIARLVMLTPEDLISIEGPFVIVDDRGSHQTYPETPHYSTDIAAAWTILPKFVDFKIESEIWPIDRWTAKVWKTVDDCDDLPMTEAEVCKFEEIPLAICRAALKATGYPG